MKTKLIFSTYFWGIILVFLGFSFLLNELLDIDIPIFTFIISALLIYLGVKLISGRSRTQKMENLNMFGNHILDYSSDLNDYSNIFGEARLDLSKVEIYESRSMEVNCIFGDFKIKLSDTLNYRIEASTIFGKTRIVEKSTEGFGNLIYTPSHFDASKPYLNIKSNVVFGNVEYF